MLGSGVRGSELNLDGRWGVRQGFFKEAIGKMSHRHWGIARTINEQDFSVCHCGQGRATPEGKE